MRRRGLSPFVWMVGDDDYIVPSELGSILAVLREHPGLPLVLVNFGVYYRDNFSVDDHAERFIAEQVKLAPEPRPSGLYKVAAIATEHDNLFTAIYPIIFRNDLAAACFNYPFRGAPFSNLVESIPTTKLILESYADAPCYWHAPIGIVGNGVNSWSRWRMRWHGAIMAETLALADIANIDSKTLYRWSKVQWDLFTEAKTQFPDENFAATVGPTALERSSHIFRQKLV